jgi:hypothetical protein
MSGARTARLNANLVLTGQAYTANLVTAYPGDRHACTALLYALPAAGVSLGAMETALAAQLRGLAEAGPSAKELQRVKKVCLLHSWFWHLLNPFLLSSGGG